MLAFAAFTTALVENKQEEWDEAFEVGNIYTGTTRFNVYIMLYATQWLILPVFRAFSWMLIACCSCCSDAWNKEFDGNIDREIWSSKFIEFELGQLDNF
mmetsp:Transcript_18626/g.23218  ORF Transcript_18626/g.23218 Transcript_18626/m.23218 type:complete len:99 (-) Transcript_18626:856-1152(-)